MVVSRQFNYTKGTGSMPFILPTLLGFQGSTHRFGVGSFSILNAKRCNMGLIKYEEKELPGNIFVPSWDMRCPVCGITYRGI